MRVCPEVDVGAGGREGRRRRLGLKMSSGPGHQSAGREPHRHLICNTTLGNITTNTNTTTNTTNINKNTNTNTIVTTLARRPKVVAGVS